MIRDIIDLSQLTAPGLVLDLGRKRRAEDSMLKGPEILRQIRSWRESTNPYAHCRPRRRVVVSG